LQRNSEDATKEIVDVNGTCGMEASQSPHIYSEKPSTIPSKTCDETVSLMADDKSTGDHDEKQVPSFMPSLGTSNYSDLPPQDIVARGFLSGFSLRFANLQQLYKNLVHFDMSNPVVAVLAISTKVKVEQMIGIAKRWGSEQAFIKSYKIYGKKYAGMLEEEPLTVPEMIYRVKEVVLCKSLARQKQVRLQLAKEFLLDALHMYQVNPAPAEGRSGGAYLMDLLSFFKGKRRQMWTEGDDPPVIDTRTFGTTGDLLVWECKSYLFDCHLSGAELDPDVFDVFKKAKPQILADEGWDPISWLNAEVENDETYNDVRAETGDVIK
jgi:hypothetical protein